MTPRLRNVGEPVLDEAKRVPATRPRMVATRPMALLAFCHEIAPRHVMVLDAATEGR